jgi:hypothetical protein
MAKISKSGAEQIAKMFGIDPAILGAPAPSGGLSASNQGIFASGGVGGLSGMSFGFKPSRTPCAITDCFEPGTTSLQVNGEGGATVFASICDKHVAMFKAGNELYQFSLIEDEMPQFETVEQADNWCAEREIARLKVDMAIQNAPGDLTTDWSQQIAADFRRQWNAEYDRQVMGVRGQGVPVIGIQNVPAAMQAAQQQNLQQQQADHELKSFDPDCALCTAKSPRPHTFVGHQKKGSS